MMALGMDHGPWAACVARLRGRSLWASVLFGFVMALAGTNAAHAGHELDGRDLVAGKTLYADNCAACHGADLEGAPDWQVPDENGVLPAPPHDETGHTWHHSNVQNFDYTKLGGAKIVERMGLSSFTSGMPGFEGQLTDDEIWDILAFIHSNWPEDIQALHQTRNPPHE